MDIYIYIYTRIYSYIHYIHSAIYTHIDIIQKGHPFSHIFPSGCVGLSGAGTLLGEHMFLGLRRVSQAGLIWDSWIHPLGCTVY